MPPAGTVSRRRLKRLHVLDSISTTRTRDFFVVGRPVQASNDGSPDVGESHLTVVLGREAVRLGNQPPVMPCWLACGTGKGLKGDGAAPCAGRCSFRAPVSSRPPRDQGAVDAEFGRYQRRLLLRADHRINHTPLVLLRVGPAASHSAIPPLLPPSRSGATNSNVALKAPPGGACGVAHAMSLVVPKTHYNPKNVCNLK